MAASASGHGHQTICAFFNRFVGKFVVDDVVQHHAAVAVRGLVDFFTRTQRRDDDRHFVFHAHRHVVFQTVVALVHDLVDGKGCSRSIGVRLVVRRQGFADFSQPLVQLRRRTSIERRHGAHHPSDALGNHQLGVADDEQRRSDDGKRHGGQGCGKVGHGTTPIVEKRPRA